MRKLTKILALLLAGITTLLPLASCAEGSGTFETTGAQTTEVPADTTAAQTEPAAPVVSESAQKYLDALNGLMDTINKDYYNKRSHVLSGEPRSGGLPALWGFGAYLEALADWYSVCPDDADVKSYYVDALDKCLPKYRVETNALKTPAGTFRNIVYYNAGAGGQNDFYYDDNAWICYQLLNAYVQLGDENYLTQAEELLEFFKTGWDDKLGGGIYWDKSFGGKNTCENGPIAICFLWAYQLTQKADYLEWGTKIYQWMYDNLRDGNLYNDSKGLDGGVNNWKADYNQGTPIYAACLLYEITGEEDYLKQAKNTANAALGLAFATSGSRNNVVVTINNNPIYKSWCVGWLLRGFEKYVEVSGKAGSFFQFMEQVLDKTLENPDKNGYYDPYFGSSGWDSEPRTDVLQPSGVASVIAICARYELKVAPNL